MNLKYKIPFGSYKGNQYDVEIYDTNYTGSAITLTGGTDTFVSTEDASDDVFTPIRTKTATIRVENQYKVGGTTKYMMDELQPISNTSNPVRLILKGATAAQDTVVWQGYLNCEEYEQVYNQVPQYFEITANSMLETLKSVEVTQDDMIGRVKIRQALYTALNKVQTANVVTFGNVCVSFKSKAILDKYIETYHLYKTNTDTVSDKQFDYRIENPTAYSILELVAKYMGWCVREEGMDIYFQRIGDDTKMRIYAFSAFNDGSSYDDDNMTTFSMQNDPEWRGTDHSINIARGAKKITVNSKVYDADYNILALPEFYLRRNYSWSIEYKIDEDTQSSPHQYKSLWFYFDRHPDDDGIILYKNYLLYGGEIPSRPTPLYLNINEALSYFLDNYNNIKGGYIAQDVPGSSYSCLSVCQIVHGGYYPSGETPDNYYLRGLLISTTRSFTQFDDYVARIKSNRKIKFTEGDIRVKIELHNVDLIPIKNDKDEVIGYTKFFRNSFWYSLKIGNKYYDRSNGSLSDSIIKNKWEVGINTNEEYYIPVGIFYIPQLEGYVEFTIYPYMGNDDVNIPLVFIKSISIDYVVEKTDYFSSESEHIYTRIINKNFDEEISIDCDLATVKNDNRSPSLVLNSDTAKDYMESLSYEGAETASKVPEVDLLERMNGYYGQNRRVIGLIANKPSAALPMTKYTGIGDGKTYAPVSEERNYETDTSTIKCMEIPENQ